MFKPGFFTSWWMYEPIEDFLFKISSFACWSSIIWPLELPLRLNVFYADYISMLLKCPLDFCTESPYLFASKTFPWLPWIISYASCYASFVPDLVRKRSPNVLPETERWEPFRVRGSVLLRSEGRSLWGAFAKVRLALDLIALSVKAIKYNDN